MENIFNPEDFGFEVYEVKRGYRGVKGDYILRARGGNLRISLCEDTYRNIFEILSDNIGVAINDKGILLLFECNEPKKMVKINKTKSCRRYISIRGLDDILVSFYGEFKRVPLATELHSSGKAILLIPQVEKVEML